MSETTVSSLTDEVDMRRKEVEKCRLQLASKRGEQCFTDLGITFAGTSVMTIVIKKSKLQIVTCFNLSNYFPSTSLL